MTRVEGRLSIVIYVVPGTGRSLLCPSLIACAIDADTDNCPNYESPRMQRIVSTQTQ